MKDGFLKVGVASPKFRLANVKENLKKHISVAKEAENQGVKVLAFPELSLTCYSLRDIFFNSLLLKAGEMALCEFIDETSKLDLISFVGVPVSKNGKIYDCSAVVCHGKLLGLVPKFYLDNGVESPETRWFSQVEENIEIDFAGQRTVLGNNVLFCDENNEKIKIGVEIGSELFENLSPGTLLCDDGATIIVNSSALCEIVGRREKTVNAICAFTEKSSSAYLYANAGVGESSGDSVFGGNSFIGSCGSIYKEKAPFSNEDFVACEIDLGAIEANRRKKCKNLTCDCLCVDFALENTETVLENHYCQTPFVPENEKEMAERCRLILQIQAQGLAGRIERAHAKCSVIGVSGGLDSTLAMIVTALAYDALARERKELLAVTMPCFGTTKRTKGNAEKLTEELGGELITVDIKNSVESHFRDIGHDGKTLDVTFENAQARERTQVLMDIANARGGFVVGTGDLSELMLGWATYNGDHMSMYAVNSSLPKTLIRKIVEVYANDEREKGNVALADVLDDILATPVSPELLPPKNGEIAQCTENIVGPYELHDFFIYYTLKYAYSPKKILRLAKVAFRGKYTDDVILGWLKVFLRRFFTQQFKRSCLPDGPKVGSLSVSPRGDLLMPSDSDFSMFVEELDDLI